MPPKTLFQHQQASYSKLLTSNLCEFFYIHQTLLQQSQQNFLFSRKQSVVRLENF